MIKNFLSNSMWLFFGNSIGRLSMFLVNIIAARVLSQEVFGQFSMLRNTISMIEGIISGTLGSPMIRRISEVSQKEQNEFNTLIKSLFTINLSISLILSFLIYLLAPFIIDIFFLNNEELIKSLYIGCVILIATTLSGLIQKIFIGIEQYKKLAVSSIYASLVSFPIITILIYYYHLNGALFGIVAYFSVDFIIKYYQFRKINKYEYKKIKYELIITETKKLLLFSYPLLGSIIISSITFWYARVIIVESDGFSSIGIFDAAFQWLTIIMVITGATTSVVLPMFSKNIDNKKEFKKILIINLIVNFMISLLFTVIFIIFSKEIMSIYGENYIKGYQILIILSISSIFFSLSSILNKVLISLGYTKIIFYIVFINSILLIVLLKYDVLINILGLSLAFLIFYIGNFLLYIIFYIREIN
jgi:O-antigen/teichoic acid export membrane protein